MISVLEDPVILTKTVLYTLAEKNQKFWGFSLGKFLKWC